MNYEKLREEGLNRAQRIRTMQEMIDTQINKLQDQLAEEKKKSTLAMLDAVFTRMTEGLIESDREYQAIEAFCNEMKSMIDPPAWDRWAEITITDNKDGTIRALSGKLINYSIENEVNRENIPGEMFYSHFYTGKRTVTIELQGPVTITQD